MLVRSAVSKIIRVGKAEVFLMGLATIVDLIVEVASAVLGPYEDFFTCSRNQKLNQEH